MSTDPLEEFLSIVRRDLAAEDARIVAADEHAPEGAVERSLPGDHRLILHFGEAPPPDLEARLRRLDMLVDSFQSMLAAELTAMPAARPSPARSLHEELAALARRAGAIDALVIDARSPVVWGAAVEELAERLSPLPDVSGELPITPAPGPVEAAGEPETTQDTEAPVRHLQAAPELKLQAAPELKLASTAKPDRKGGASRVKPGAKVTRDADDPQTGRIVPHYPRPVPDPEPEPASPEPSSERAIQAVRALPEMTTLHKGGHIHVSVSEPDFGYVARSFAGIYVLVLVFREAFDELRAKRATVHALPIIERLVLALPPLDPAPMAGAVALRRPRRRR